MNVNSLNILDPVFFCTIESYKMNLEVVAEERKTKTAKRNGNGKYRSIVE